MHDGPATAAPERLNEPVARVRRALKALVLRAAPAVRCEACGTTLFRGVAIVQRGEVKLIGAEQVVVAVDFATMNQLVFRHAESSECSERANVR